jgi:hypothetical protein
MAGQQRLKRNIEWEGNPQNMARTDRLLDWIESNPIERLRLFSDSTQAAIMEDRMQEVIKTTKSVIHGKIAKYVFENDHDMEIRADYARDSQRYLKSVESRLSS